MTWQFRRANPDDLTAIMQIEEAEFGTDAWSEATMRDELSHRNTYYLVAFPPEDPGQVQAYGGVSVATGSGQADIRTIAVAPDVRRRGLGRALVLSLVSEARSRGARQVFLEVRADNSGAQRLYDSVGFEPISLRVAYYQPDGVDAVIMRLEIPEPRLSPAAGSA